MRAAPAAERLLALLPPAAEGSSLATALTASGFTVRPGGAALSADVVLPAKGGSLAFLLLRTPNAVPDVSRVAAAAKAARRCTVLWICPDAIDTTQPTASAAGCALLPPPPPERSSR